MTPFKYLTELADKIKEKTGKCCHVTASYWAFEHSKQMEYELYLESYTYTKRFKTVSELITEMQSIINPIADTGILLEDFSDGK